MAVDYGGMVGPISHGVPTEMFYGWSDLDQDKWVQDYYRTQEQQDYSLMEDKSSGYQAAYWYTYLTDVILGTEAVETGERVNETIEDVHDAVTDPVNQTVALALGLGLLYVALKVK